MKVMSWNGTKRNDEGDANTENAKKNPQKRNRPWNVAQQINAHTVERWLKYIVDEFSQKKRVFGFFLQ